MRLAGYVRNSGKKAVIHWCDLDDPVRYGDSHTQARNIGNQTVGSWEEGADLVEKRTGRRPTRRNTTPDAATPVGPVFRDEYTPDIAADGTLDDAAKPHTPRDGSETSGDHDRYRDFLFAQGYRNVDAKERNDKRDILGSASAIELDTPVGEAKAVICCAKPVNPRWVTQAWDKHNVNIIHVPWVSS